MRGCGITPFFCVDKFYIHVDLFVSSQKMAIDCNLYLRCEQKF